MPESDGRLDSVTRLYRRYDIGLTGDHDVLSSLSCTAKASDTFTI
jgi:hypothetical protein